MVTQELFRYVQDGLANDKTKDQLQKELLLAGGWQVSDIDEVFAAVEGRMVTPKEKKSGFGKFLLFLLILGAVGFAAWYFYGDQIKEKVLVVLGQNDPSVPDPAPVVQQVINDDSQDQNKTISWELSSDLLGYGTVYYESRWSVKKEDDSPDVPGQVIFTLPNQAMILWGGRQSDCGQDFFGEFQYGISTVACVKGARAEIAQSNLTLGGVPVITAENKNAFGDFVLKNK